MNEYKDLAKKAFIVAVIACLAYLFAIRFDAVWAMFINIVSIFTPLFIGGGIAFVLNVPLKQIEKLLVKKWGEKKWTRSIAILVTYLLFFAFIALILFVIIPQLANSLVSLANNLSKYLLLIVEVINEALAKWNIGYQIDISELFNTPLSDIGPMIVEWMTEYSETVQQWISKLGSGVAGGVASVTGSIISAVVNGLFSIMFSIYILSGKEKIKKQATAVANAFLSEAVIEKTKYIIGRANSVFADFITGQLCEMAILGSIFFVVMSVSKLPYAFLIAFFIAITSIVPYFGTTIAMVIGAILIFADTGLIKMIIFIVEFLIIQQIEDNLIYPHVVGNSVGIPAIWVLLAINVFGKLMGILGLIIGVPLMALIYTLMADYVYSHQKRR